MHTNEKRAAALKLLALKGMGRNVYEPHHLRLLWYFGFDLPPPHFASFLSNTLINGAFSGVLFGALTWVLRWFRGTVTLSGLVEDAVFFGVFYGIGMAVYYACSRRKNGLPSWQDFNP